MAFETIVVETEEHVTTIRLNRPDALNALSPELLGELAEAVEAASTDAKVRCIIITGSEHSVSSRVSEAQNRRCCWGLLSACWMNAASSASACSPRARHSSSWPWRTSSA